MCDGCGSDVEGAVYRVWVGAYGPEGFPETAVRVCMGCAEKVRRYRHGLYERAGE